VIQIQNKDCFLQITLLIFVLVAPRLAVNGVLDGKEMVDGAVIPATDEGVPEGCTSTFWVTILNDPFVFPTFSHWFIIPGKRNNLRLHLTDYN